MMKMICEDEEDIKGTCIDMKGKQTTNCMECIDNCGNTFFAFDFGFDECPMMKMVCEDEEEPKK